MTAILRELREILETGLVSGLDFNLSWDAEHFFFQMFSVNFCFFLWDWYIQLVGPSIDCAVFFLMLVFNEFLVDSR